MFHCVVSVKYGLLKGVNQLNRTWEPFDASETTGSSISTAPSISSQQSTSALNQTSSSGDLFGGDPFAPPAGSVDTGPKKLNLDELYKQSQPPPGAQNGFGHNVSLFTFF